jgi:hypothetical protein
MNMMLNMVPSKIIILKSLKKRMQQMMLKKTHKMKKLGLIPMMILLNIPLMPLIPREVLPR